MLSNQKSNETRELVQSGDEPPPPLKSPWDFFETEYPRKTFLKQLEYEIYWYKINQYE